MSRTVADVLRAAKARIDSPEKWTTGQMLDSRDGRMCALGALHTENYPDTPISQYRGDYDSPWIRVEKACGMKELSAAAILHKGYTHRGDYYPLACSVYRVNDNRDQGHSTVMAMFDDAITIAETTGATCGD